MPSGAKKRKAAKRRKEQEEHQQQPGAHTPGSPTSPTAGPSHPPKGNGERHEAEDDLTSQEGKGSEGGGEFASPTVWDNNLRRLEVEADDEQAEPGVETEGKGKGKEIKTTGIVDTVSAMESTENGGSELPCESLAPQKAEDEIKNEAEVPVAVVEVQKDNIPLLPPSDLVPPTSAEVPISEPEEVSAEHFRSEKGKKVAVLGDTSPSIEHKQLDVVDATSPVELSVPISEEVVQASDIPVETLELVESQSEAPSNKNEQKVVPLTDAAGGEQPDLGVESHPQMETHDITGTTEVARSTHLQHRTSWMSCCGLFDVITGANR